MRAYTARIVSMMVALAPVVLAQEPDLRKEVAALRARLDELEEQQATIADRLGNRALVQSFSADALDVGGHLSSLFTHMHGDGGDGTGHMVSLFELFVKARLGEQWSVFATPGFYLYNGALVDNPITPTSSSDPAFLADDSTQVRTFLARLQAEWAPSDLVQVRGGIVGSPHGTTNREYFIPSRQIAQGSLHTRYFLGNQLYPQQVVGFAVAGRVPVGSSGDRIDYDAYFGSEPDSADDGIGGARLAYLFGASGLSVAANYGRGTREAVPDATTNFGNLQSPFALGRFAARDYELVGLDVDWRLGALIHKTEVYSSREEGFADQLAVSTETSWFVTPQWAVTYRFDYYDPGSDLAPLLSAVAPQGHATEHVVGVCFDPTAGVRLRLDGHHLLLPQSDETADFLNLSWSVSF